MKKKLPCILLIDDDEPTNFIHEMVIRRVNCADKIVTVESATEGLDYLKNTDHPDYVRPSLIFLDINMPGVTGWEFLESYENLSPSQRAEVVIVMLTTSLNPDDKTKADTIAHVNSYENKVLNTEKLESLLKTHFAEYV